MKHLCLCLVFFCVLCRSERGMGEHLFLPVWQSTGPNERAAAGFLNSRGVFIVLFRTSTATGAPAGYWIEEAKWSSLLKLAPQTTTAFNVGPDSATISGQRVLRIRPAYVAPECPPRKRGGAHRANRIAHRRGKIHTSCSPCAKREHPGILSGKDPHPILRPRSAGTV